ncbi:MAG: hypothetical protein V6Z89_11925 [Desulfobacter sp.]
MTPESAEQIAIKLIREDESIKNNIHNGNDDPPIIYVDNIIEVGWFEFLRKRPGSGYTFYQNEDE